MVQERLETFSNGAAEALRYAREEMGWKDATVVDEIFLPSTPRLPAESLVLMARTVARSRSLYRWTILVRRDPETWWTVVEDSLAESDFRRNR